MVGGTMDSLMLDSIIEKVATTTEHTLGGLTGDTETMRMEKMGYSKQMLFSEFIDK